MEAVANVEIVWISSQLLKYVFEQVFQDFVSEQNLSCIVFRFCMFCTIVTRRVVSYFVLGSNGEEALQVPITASLFALQISHVFGISHVRFVTLLDSICSGISTSLSRFVFLFYYAAELQSKNDPILQDYINC